MTLFKWAEEIMHAFKEHRILVFMFILSFGISAFVLIVQLFASRILPSEVFVSITLIIYKVGLVGAFAGLANDFYIMRTNSDKREDATVINTYSFFYYLIVLSLFIFLFWGEEYIYVMVLVSIFSALSGLYSSRLRLLDEVVISSFTERFIPLMTAIILLIVIVQKYYLNYELIDVVGNIFIVAIILFVCVFLSVIRNMSLTISIATDSQFLAHQFLIYISILFFASFTYLDKVIVEKYLSTEQIAYYIILFQVFSVYKILGQSIYKYLFTRMRNGLVSTIGLKIILVSVLLVGAGTVFVYAFFTEFYRGKFEIYFIDVALISTASALFVLYQLFAAKIDSTFGALAIIYVNISSFISLLLVAPLFAYGIKYKNITYLLISFLVYWLFKVGSGLYIVKKEWRRP